MTHPCPHCGGSLYAQPGYTRRYVSCLACGRSPWTQPPRIAEPAVEVALPPFMERTIAALMEQASLFLPAAVDGNGTVSQGDVTVLTGAAPRENMRALRQPVRIEHPRTFHVHSFAPPEPAASTPVRSTGGASACLPAAKGDARG